MSEATRRGKRFDCPCGCLGAGNAWKFAALFRGAKHDYAPAKIAAESHQLFAVTGCACADRLVRVRDMESVGFGQDPVYAGDFEAGALCEVPDVNSLAGADVSDTRRDGKRGDFDGVIADAGNKLECAFEVPTFKHFVANGELHKKNIFNRRARAVLFKLISCVKYVQFGCGGCRVGGDADTVSRVIRNVIFDWSGTLVDDLPAVLEASNYVFAMAGVPKMDLDQFRREFCLPFTKFYDRYVPHVPISQLEEWFHDAFRRCRHMVAEIPHAREFLEFCREHRLRTFLLSSVHRDHYIVQAEATGFGAYLDHVFVEVRDKRTKMRGLVAEHGLLQDETIFVGDMEHDVEAARAGGVYACAVLTGYNHPEQLRACAPDLLVEHLGELRDWLTREGFEIRAALEKQESEQQQS